MPSDPEPDPLKAPLLFAEEEDEQTIGIKKGNLTKPGFLFLMGDLDLEGMLNWAESEEEGYRALG